MEPRCDATASSDCSLLGGFVLEWNSSIWLRVLLPGEIGMSRGVRQVPGGGEGRVSVAEGTTGSQQLGGKWETRRSDVVKICSWR